MITVDVRRRLGNFTVDARFTTAGGVTALFGRSGSGKTTLVNMIAGLVRPDDGHISVEGRVLFNAAAGVDEPPERRRLGYVFQDGRLFPHMSVRGNLRYGLKRAPRAERGTGFARVVELLDLGALLDRRPATLSGGEKQRVAIGRALLAAPRILLMDEPLASLDAARRDEILPFIERLRDEFEMPIIYVSHAIDEVVRLADTLVLLNDGRVAAAGPVEEIMSRLDLRPLTGRHEAGAVIAATVAGHDDEFALTRLSFARQSLWVPCLDLPPGAAVRARIRARDVALSLGRPRNSSVLNILAGVVREVPDDEGPQIDILLDVGQPLIARITRRSAARLGLVPGRKVHALVKSIAIDRHSLGGIGRGARP